MEIPFELEALKYVEGPLYTKHRDAWLRGTPDARSILARYEQRPDWRSKVTAKILLAWLDHRKEMEDLVNETEHVNWDQERWKAGGIEVIFQGYGSSFDGYPEDHGWLLPLCWETALKRLHEWDVLRRKIFFAMVRQAKDELTIDLLFWYVRVIADTRRERELGVWGLSLRPVASIKPRVERMRRDDDETVKLFATTFQVPFGHVMP